MRQVSTFRWIPAKDSEQEVAKVLSPSIRYALEDCVDLPPTIIQNRDCELSPEQRRHYDELVKDAVTTLKGDNIVTAVNSAVLVNKLTQAAVGVLYGADGSTIKIDFGPRIKLLKEIIEEADRKVIVFAPLTGALRAIAEELRKHWTVEVVDGSTGKGKRNQIFGDFQRSTDPRILVANPETMAHGLTLTAATSIVWYAPTNKNEIYEQANARIARPGQTRTTHIVHIAGSPVERKTYTALREKGRLQQVVLDLVRGEK